MITPPPIFGIHKTVTPGKAKGQWCPGYDEGRRCGDGEEGEDSGGAHYIDNQVLSGGRIRVLGDLG